jgi:hypothetical protein
MDRRTLATIGDAQEAKKAQRNKNRHRDTRDD